MTAQTPPTFKLNTGAEIPAIGLGTWQAAPGEVREAVKTALELGYRHLDCALMYKNEAEVGQGIKDSGIPRSQIFITSKLWCSFHNNVAESLRRTLEALDTDYLDLFASISSALVHWPVRLVPNETSELLPVNPDGTRATDKEWKQSDTWRQMEGLYASGKVKAIGVSNFSVPYLEELKKTWKVVPAVNQVELHPFLPQLALREYCAKEGIQLEAYSPLGSTNSPLLSDPHIAKLAEKYGTTPATILISYHVSQGVVVLPKSVSPKRIADNLRVVQLDKEDIAHLNGLAPPGKTKRFTKPAWGSSLGFDDW